MNRGNVFLIVGALLCMYFLSCQGIGFADIDMAAFLATPTVETAEGRAAVEKVIPPKAPLASNPGLAGLEEARLEKEWQGLVQTTFLNIKSGEARSDAQLITLPAAVVIGMNDVQIREITQIANQGNYGVSIAVSGDDAAVNEQIVQVINRFIAVGELQPGAKPMDLLEKGVPIARVSPEVLGDMQRAFANAVHLTDYTLNKLSPETVQAYKGAV